MCNVNPGDVLTCPGGNASGIVKTLQYAYLPHVDVIPAAETTSHKIVSDITMVADTGDATAGRFYDMQLKEEGLQYSAEEDGDSEDGNLIHTITGKIPKMDADKSFILNSVRGGAEFIVVLTDRNRYTQLMGDKVEGATISVSATSDGNGYPVTITWRSPNLLYGYEGAVPVA